METKRVSPGACLWSVRWLGRFVVAGALLTVAGCGETVGNIGISTEAISTIALPAYPNANLYQTSVSGISAGGYFATQYQLAFSSYVIGAGVEAGGPDDCAQDSSSHAVSYCMYNLGCTSYMNLSLSTLESNVRNWASSGAIDPLSNLANHKIYLFSSSGDTTVATCVMNALQQQYLDFGVPSGNITYESRSKAVHGWIEGYAGATTDFAGAPISANDHCGNTGEPYIQNCSTSDSSGGDSGMLNGADTAKTILTKIYGTLNARNASPAAGNYFKVDQTAFGASHSNYMETYGYLYVPSACQQGAACKVHVAFHGCLQYPAYTFTALPSGQQITFGTTFVVNSGLNNWADTNNIIVLYPQGWGGGTADQVNPNGCFDWWGYDGANYGQKAGTQASIVNRMVQHLTGH